MVMKMTSVYLHPPTTSNQQLTYTVTVNGSDKVTVTGITDFVTTWTFSATTLSLSFPSRQTAFVFTEVASFSN